MSNRKAFSFLEVIVTLVILALIGAFLALGASKTFDNFADKNAKDRLLILAASQSQFHLNRGRFALSTEELTAIEPNYSYVTQGSSTTGEALSVDYYNNKLGIATLSSSGKCFLLAIHPPSSNIENSTGILTNNSACSGTDALGLSGEGW